MSSWVQQNQIGAQVQMQPTAPVQGTRATAQAWSACGHQSQQFRLAGMSCYAQSTPYPAFAQQALSAIQTPHTWPAEPRWPLQTSQGHTAGGSGCIDNPSTPLQRLLVGAGGPSQVALQQEGFVGNTLNAQPGWQVSTHVAQQAPKAAPSLLGGQEAHEQSARTTAGNSCVVPPALLGATSLQEHSRQVEVACSTRTAQHELSAGLCVTVPQGNHLLPQHAPRGPSMLSEDDKARMSRAACPPGSPRKMTAQGMDSLPSQAISPQGATDGLRSSGAADPHQQSRHGGIDSTTSQHEVLVAASVSLPAHTPNEQQQGVQASLGGSHELDRVSKVRMVPLPSGQAVRTAQLAGQQPPLHQLSEGGYPAGRLSSAGGRMPKGQALPGSDNQELLREMKHMEDPAVAEVHCTVAPGVEALLDSSKQQVVRLTARSPALR